MSITWVHDPLLTRASTRTRTRPGRVPGILPCFFPAFLRLYRTLGLLLPLLLLPSPAAARPEVELVTMGPGASLFDGFGHAALRVVDEQAGKDRVYAFGALSTRGYDPLLGWRFLRGEVLFEARARPWQQVLMRSIVIKMREQG